MEPIEINEELFKEFPELSQEVKPCLHWAYVREDDPNFSKKYGSFKNGDPLPLPILEDGNGGFIYNANTDITSGYEYIDTRFSGISS